VPIFVSIFVSNLVEDDALAMTSKTGMLLHCLQRRQTSTLRPKVWDIYPVG
jgi:hypothetical protein